MLASYYLEKKIITKENDKVKMNTQDKHALNICITYELMSCTKLNKKIKNLVGK